jgi:hypothetical protein
MNIRSMTGICAALTMIVLSKPLLSQDASAKDAPNASTRWHSDHVVYVAGLEDVRPGSTGSLSLTLSAVAFVGRAAAAGEIPLDRITAVYLGDERVATGGTTAKVARHIPIYGFGAAMGAVTNKSVDLLTIEFQDNNSGYHGAVFEVQKTQGAIAQQQLLTLISPPPLSASQPCIGVGSADTIRVEPITSADVELPAEYRVLLYEQLVTQLRATVDVANVYRMGDTKAPCAAKTMQLSVTAFKKGNEAVRTSTGPVGHFVGGTSVKFHVALTNTSGSVLFEKSMKESKRGDGDSLGVTRDLAKSIAKHLKKAKQISTSEVS